MFQEMDSIVDQMMTVAEYIGWETKELRPVIFYPILLDMLSNWLIYIVQYSMILYKNYPFIYL